MTTRVSRSSRARSAAARDSVIMALCPAQFPTSDTRCRPLGHRSSICDSSLARLSSARVTSRRSSFPSGCSDSTARSTRRRVRRRRLRSWARRPTITSSRTRSASSSSSTVSANAPSPARTASGHPEIRSVCSFDAAVATLTRSSPRQAVSAPPFSMCPTWSTEDIARSSRRTWPMSTSPSWVA